MVLPATVVSQQPVYDLVLDPVSGSKLHAVQAAFNLDRAGQGFATGVVPTVHRVARAVALE